MAYTIVLSGPMALKASARRALQQAGLRVLPEEHQHGHGLPSKTDGTGDPSIDWVVVEAEHPDEVPAHVLGMGFAVRSYFPSESSVAFRDGNNSNTSVPRRVDSINSALLQQKVIH